MPKLKKGRAGESRERQECGVGGNWLIGKQLALRGAEDGACLAKSPQVGEMPTRFQ